MPNCHIRRIRLLIVAAASLTVLLLGAVSPALAAVESKFDVTHLYSAAHSVTGSCVVSPEDPVADPQCSDTPPGPLPPEGPLARPRGGAVDAYGNQYVVNRGSLVGDPDAYLDIFDPEGRYIGGFNITDTFLSAFGQFANGRARNVVVDSTGHIYLSVEGQVDGGTIVRYDPTAYEPEAGEIEYGSPPVLLIETGGSEALAVNPANDHFYVQKFGRVAEYGAPTNGVPNELVTDKIGEGVLRGVSNGSVAIDALHDRLYVVDGSTGPGDPMGPRINVLSATAPYEFLTKFDGSTTPAGEIASNVIPFEVPLTVDEATGNVFYGYKGRIYELRPDGTYVGTIKDPKFIELRQLNYDNSELSPNRGFLYAQSGEAVGHLYAFEPKFAFPPKIQSLSVTGIGEDEAVLRATIKPGGEPLHYVFEYTTQKDYEENNFANAQVVGEGDLEPSSAGVAVSTALTGLSSGSTYHFRVRAENDCAPGGCKAEAEHSFATFAADAQSGSCGNQALRTGSSASLPDCRAYELVTPADTGGREPGGPVSRFASSGPTFGTWSGAPDGSSILWTAQGGAIPDQDTPGGFNGDQYVTRRGAGGWSTEAAGLTGRQSSGQLPGGFSPDHSFGIVQSFETHGVEGEIESGRVLLRYPDGSVHLLADGSIGEAMLASPTYIAPGGQHAIFSAQAAQLEPNAPPAGTQAIYDRAPDGTLRVVSLLPGDVTPGSSASTIGVSFDGTTVAFQLAGGSPLYLRLDNTETVEAAPEGAIYAGLSEEGRYLFYLLGGDLYRYDSEDEATQAFSEGADVIPAYMSADGSSAYFTSKVVLTPESGPNGAAAIAGQNNLYLVRGGEARFVATVAEADVKGEFSISQGRFIHGFSEWLGGIDTFGLLPIRSSADGQALLFESQADLTGFDPEGTRQIYRYDAAANTLDCLSCDFAAKAPDSDASLLTPYQLDLGDPTLPMGAGSIVPNLSRDGRRAFFESDERLVPADEDGLKDVYQWEAEGKGSCAEPGGCLFLISSGQSTENDYLFGASESGDDVFFYTSDILNGEDVEAAPSVYDARVDGGFPPRRDGAGECLGEACQPAAVAPNDPTPASSAYQGAGNVRDEVTRRCPKGKKAVRRGGKVRCVPRHPHKKHRKGKRANTDRRVQR